MTDLHDGKHPTELLEELKRAIGSHSHDRSKQLVVAIENAMESHTLDPLEQLAIVEVLAFYLHSQVNVFNQRDVLPNAIKWNLLMLEAKQDVNRRGTAREWASLLMHVSDLFVRADDLDEAASIRRRAIETLDQSVDEVSPDNIAYHENLATLYDEMAMTAPARALRSRAERLQELWRGRHS